MLDAEMVMNNHSNNHNDEWNTPSEYIEAAREVMGRIDLDPASNEFANHTVDAETYYTINDSALNYHWYGKVWMNPPYSRIIKDFVNKLVDEVDCGNITEAIVLTNNGTDTKWFHRMMSSASAICMHKGRIGFLNQNGDRIDNNNKGQIITYFGNYPSRFYETFSKFGVCALL